MEDEGRLELQHWDNLEKSIKGQPGLKLMPVLQEHDAAILERNTASAEKKATYSEREAAFLQRDLAYAERNSFLLDRDAAVAALDYGRNTSWNGQRNVSCGPLTSSKILQVLTDNPFFPREYQTAQPLYTSFCAPLVETSQSEEPQNMIKHDLKNKEGEEESTLKRKFDGPESRVQKPKKQRKLTSKMEEVMNGEIAVKNEKKILDVVINGIVFDISRMPIPICSCTGVPQQCYRWGNGGWQSACCTTNISIYPLPMNPKRRGARVAGRKMSGGAFRKLLERLGSEGHNLNYPIDLKSHWAKHGTNKFVTIR